MMSGSHLLSTAPTSSPTQTGFFSDDTKNLSVCTIAEMRKCALARNRKVGTYPWSLFYHAIGIPTFGRTREGKELSDNFRPPRANRQKATKIGMFPVSTMPTYTTGLKIRPVINSSPFKNSFLGGVFISNALRQRLSDPSGCEFLS